MESIKKVFPALILIQLIIFSCTPKCPFQPIPFVEENIRNEASLKLSNELTLILKIPASTPIKAAHMTTLSGEIKSVTSKFIQIPIDSYLAGTLNTYLEGTICNTYIMSQQVKTAEEKSHYDSLLRKQFGILTDFLETYSKGVDPEPLPGCPPLPPDREPGDPSKIHKFFKDRLIAAKNDDVRKYWHDRYQLAKAYINDCQKSNYPAQCLNNFYVELVATYSAK